MKHRTLSLSLFFILSSFIVNAATYTLDPSHTSIGFNVKYLMITDVIGQFKTYEAEIELEENTNELKGVEANIQVSSIDTENVKRDGHLKSPDFFDVEQFPNILFKSRTVNQLGTDEYEVIGDLTIKGITKTITLRGKNTGFIDAGMMGGKRAGFSATAMINRKDFGLNWNRKLDQGGLLVGYEVTIELKIQAVAST
ncbi:MAG: YceI family protein [SAR324 cluster bacterium]|nr:YceI family protein [SAR324 cluster bacterium]